MKMDGRNVLLELLLSFTVYQKSCCDVLFCGRKWLLMTDNLLLWWLCSNVKALMHMKVNG